MADRVTIRHPRTLVERQISRTAIPFFPDWDVLKSDGSVNPKPATNTKEK